MNFRSSNLHFLCRVAAFLLLLVQTLGLNADGTLLLAFKSSILSDPLSVLQSWNYEDETPCSWNGVMCTDMADTTRVISLVLRNSELQGSIPADLGMIEHLRHLDLSNNFLNGSLPWSLFNASELRVLALSNNVISGELPEFFGSLYSLEFLNLSGNSLVGKIPENLTALHHLTVLSLSHNYFSGSVPSAFDGVEVLDLSFNLINGSLPPDFVGEHLRYLNLTNNKLSGGIQSELATRIPANATLDFSFNNLTGEIPQSGSFLNQKTESFVGNQDLCGKPLQNRCSIPSTLETPPNVTATTSPGAIAVIPKSQNSSPVNGSSGTSSQQKEQKGLRPGAIVEIIVGDLAGIGFLSIISLYIYKSKKKKKNQKASTGSKASEGEEEEEEEEQKKQKQQQQQQQQQLQKEPQRKGGSLVMINGETKMDLETLLKASAYILGATGSSILYKAVLEDGTNLAVRRIGESSIERFRDFENQVRLIAKLRHPNLVRIRGFYWGADEKLIIYDYFPNGSLANVGYKKSGSSPCHLPWEVRLRLARGVARGLMYLHEKKQVHGNLKPSNILLGPNMEAKLSDFGLERLVSGDNSYKVSGSARHLGSKRSIISRDSLQDLPTGVSPSCTTSSIGSASPYLAPESLKNLKPNPKWDVYSFGIVLLELLTGKIFSDEELGQWNIGGFAVEEKNRFLRMTDIAIRGNVEGREEALLSCFKLGFSCATMQIQKRPTMKEVLHVLENISFS